MTPANNSSSVGAPWIVRLGESLWRTAVARQRWIVLGSVLAAIWFGGRALWNHVREHVVARPEYRLDAREIGITPPPPWIRADVRREVVRNAGLGDGLSILDDGLVERVRQAFSLHPWVAKVDLVSKSSPAHVEVSLTYRRPVALIKVQDGWYPVDNEAVLLPTEDFTQADIRVYPRVVGVESSPLGGVGTRWGDPVVAGGAKIGELLAPLWTDLELRAIRWIKPPSAADLAQPAIFELVTPSGAAIAWGAAPGSEPAGELPAEQKIARLKNILAQHGTLEDSAIDLRQPAPGPRTASRAVH
jgi:hypothetical protein